MEMVTYINADTNRSLQEGIVNVTLSKKSIMFEYQVYQKVPSILLYI